jgi:hypothetical protein
MTNPFQSASLMLRLAAGAGAALIAATLVYNPGNAQGRIQVWVAPSLERISQTQQPGVLTEAKVYAARGEYESFQIVVRGAGLGLNNVNVVLSDLAAPDGKAISASNYTLYREHFVYVNEASPDGGGPNRPLGPGWYPDALIPFRDPLTGADLRGTLDAAPFSVAPDRNQPVWVDLWVPPNTATGSYSGTYTVTSDQGPVTGVVTLKVWNFAMPATPTLKTAFHLWQQTDAATTVELLRNRVSPRLVEPGSQRALIDQHGLRVRDLGFWSGAHYNFCFMSAPPNVDQIRAALARHQADLFLFNYTADEIDECPAIFPTLRLWARNLHLAGVRNLVTMRPTPQLYDDGLGAGRSVVDVWVVLPVMYERAGTAIGEVMAKGDEVWSYNTLVQDGYSPKWTIDYAPVNFRIQPGFINQSLNLRGLLYWRADLFDADPWGNVNNRGRFGSYNVPGEGMLVYPGAVAGVAGVVPSMRLKWIRDGVEDFDLIESLRKAGRTASAMLTVRRIGAGWRNWVNDGAAFELARIQLGNEMHRNSTEPPPAPGLAVPDGAGGTASGVVLSWQPGAGDLDYDVHLGVTSSPAIAATTRSPFFRPADLLPDTTYYWKVIARNGIGESESPLWSFTTGPPAGAADELAVHQPFREGFSGQLLKFTFGAVPQGFTGATVLINEGPTFLNSCWLYYERAANRLQLASDDTGAWTAASLGSGQTLWNSQCVVNTRDSSAAVTADSFTLTVSVTFLPGFEGDRTVFLRTHTRAGDSPLRAIDMRTVRAGSMR